MDEIYVFHNISEVSYLQGFIDFTFKLSAIIIHLADKFYNFQIIYKDERKFLNLDQRLDHPDKSRILKNIDPNSINPHF